MQERVIKQLYTVYKKELRIYTVSLETWSIESIANDPLLEQWSNPAYRTMKTLDNSNDHWYEEKKTGLSQLKQKSERRTYDGD